MKKNETSFERKPALVVGQKPMKFPLEDVLKTFDATSVYPSAM